MTKDIVEMLEREAYEAQRAAPTTHSPTCYREHHACAVARLDRLREVAANPPRPPIRAIDDAQYNAEQRLGALLRAVRDITEGR